MIYINDWCLNEYVDSVDESLFFHGDSSEIMYDDVTIPGRDGKLHLDLNRYEEITIELNCWIRTDFRNRYRVLLNKLNALKGVTTLRCTPAPEMWGEGYYNTVFKGKISAPTTGSYLRNGSFTLTFNANPRYWLDLGQVPFATSIWLIPTTHNEEPVWETPNFTYATGKTIKLRPVGTWEEESIPSATAFLRNGSEDAIYIALLEGVETAWNNGEFFDFSSQLSDGDVFYLSLYRTADVRWEIQSDIPTGDMETFITTGSVTFQNPTPFTAKPLIKVLAVDDDYSGGTTYTTQFTVNNIFVRILRTFVTDHSGLPLYIDSELQDCYYIDANGVKQNANDYVVLQDVSKGNAVTTDFPVLKVGENLINADYGSTLYFLPMSTWSLIPRWYLI